MATKPPRKNSGTWQSVKTTFNRAMNGINIQLGRFADYLRRVPSRIRAWGISTRQSLNKWFWENNSEQFKNHAEVFFLLVGAIWAVYTFTWQDRIEPLQGPPELTLTTRLERVGVEDHVITLKAKVAVKNIGKTRVKILSAYFNLIGYNLEKLADKDINTNVYFETVRRKVEKDESKNPGANKPVQTEVSCDDRYATFRVLVKLSGRCAQPEVSCGGRYDKEVNDSRYFMRRNPTFINSGNLLIGSWLEPEEEYARDYVFFIPEKTHDLIRLQFDMYVIKDAQFIRWQNIDDFARAYPRVCSTGELDTDIRVKPYCRFCNLNNEEWRSFWTYENTFRQKFIDEHGLAHTDSLCELSLREAASPTASPPVDKGAQKP